MMIFVCNVWINDEDGTNEIQWTFENCEVIVRLALFQSFSVRLKVVSSVSMNPSWANVRQVSENCHNI